MKYFVKIILCFLLVIILSTQTSQGQKFQFVDGKDKKTRTEVINGKEVIFHSLGDCKKEEYRKINKEACEQTEQMHKALSKNVIGKTITIPQKKYPTPEFSILLMEVYRSTNPQIQAEVGFRYIVGFGTNRNLKKAIEWYKKAALQDYKPAKIILGNLLASGLTSKLALLGENGKPLNNLIYFGEKKFDHFSYDNCINQSTNSEYDLIELKELVADLNIKLNKATQLINDGNEVKAKDLLASLKLESASRLGRKCSYYRTISNIHNAVETKGQGYGIINTTEFQIEPHTSDEILQSVYSKPTYMLMIGEAHLEQKNDKEAKAWLKEVAQIDTKYADYYLNLNDYFGLGTLQEYQWFKAHAEQGNPHAQYRLGTFYNEGIIVSKNAKIAFQWFLKSAKQGYVYAQYRLSLMYDDGRGTPRDVMKAYEWFMEAAKQGHLATIYNIGNSYAQTQRNKFKWSLKEAINGKPDAQYKIGTMYENGMGIKRDYHEALKWYMKAAEQGNHSSYSSIGLMYYEGKGVFKDFTKAHEWFLKAAREGNALAQYKVAVMYRDGTFVQQDYVQAFKWFMKAANQNNEEAIYNIGVMYGEGIGTKIDYIKSYDFLIQIANKGNTEAQYQIAKLLEGQKIDSKRISQYPLRDSILWYLRSAILRNVEAQVRLSNINKKIGNPIKAWAWANIVQIQEPKIALDLKNELHDLLTKEQIDEANNFTEKYKQYMMQMNRTPRRPSQAMKELFYVSNFPLQLGLELSNLYDLVVDTDLLKKSS